MNCLTLMKFSARELLLWCHLWGALHIWGKGDNSTMPCRFIWYLICMCDEQAVCPFCENTVKHIFLSKAFPHSCNSTKMLLLKHMMSKTTFPHPLVNTSCTSFSDHLSIDVIDLYNFFVFRLYLDFT